MLRNELDHDHDLNDSPSSLGDPRTYTWATQRTATLCHVSCHLDIAEANGEIFNDLHRAWILSLSDHRLLFCPSLQGMSSGKSPGKDQHFLNCANMCAGRWLANVFKVSQC